jgi:hypothetical protein
MSSLRSAPRTALALPIVLAARISLSETTLAQFQATLSAGTIYRVWARHADRGA